MGDVNVMQRDPQKRWGYLAHKLARDVDREFIRGREGLGVSLEIIDRELQDGLKLLQFKLAAQQFGSEIGSLVVVAQQMLKVVAAPRSRCRYQTLGQNYTRAEAWPVRSMTTFSDTVKAVAGRDHPSIGRWPLQIFAEIFEHRGRFGGNRGEVVERFINAGRQAGSCNVVAQDSA